MTNKIKLARTLSRAFHKHNKYGNEPYVRHLDDVYNVLIKFNVTDEDILCAAYLHDVLEDTDVSEQTLVKLFGWSVISIVKDVTCSKTGSRVEKHAEAYPRIRKNEKSVILKLADRIANVSSGGKLNMYKKEHPFFRTILFRETDSSITLKMWEYLDNLIKDIK